MATTAQGVTYTNRPQFTSETSNASFMRESGIFNDDVMYGSSYDLVADSKGVNEPSHQTVPPGRRFLAEEAEKKYRAVVIRKLLKNFRLEDTLDYYRNISSVSYRVNPADFSLDCSMPAQQLKDRLVRLTGSNIVMVNDDKYMAKLRQSIWDEYQRKLDKDEKLREEEEQQRLRKLLDRGLVSVSQLRDEYNFHLKKSKGRNQSLSPLRSARLKKSHSSTGSKKKSPGTNDSPERSKTAPKSASRSQTTPRYISVGRPIYAASPSDRTWTPALTQDSRSARSTGRSTGRGDSIPFETQPRVTLLDEDDEIEENIQRDRRSSRPATSSPAWLQRYQDPLVLEMRREQSVDGLYKLASQIVYANNNDQKRK